MFNQEFRQWLGQQAKRQHLTARQLSLLRQQIEQLEQICPFVSAPPETLWLQSFIESFARFPDDKWLLDYWIDQRFLTEIDPLWLWNVTHKFVASTSHTYILHLNVNDYVFDSRFGMQPLNNYLHFHFEQVHPFLIYNRSRGLVGSDMEYIAHDWRNEQPIPKKQIDSEDLRLFAERARGTSLEDLLRAARSQQRSLSDRFLADPSDALFLLEEMLHNFVLLEPGPAEAAIRENDPAMPSQIVLFEYAEKLFGGDERTSQGDVPKLLQIETLQRWALDRQILRGRNLILLLARSLDEISETLRRATSQIEQIEIPLPGERARLKYIMYKYWELLEKHDFRLEFQGHGKTNGDGTPLEQMQHFAHMSAGLSRLALEDIIMRAVNETNGILGDDDIRTRRESVIKTESAGLLDVMSPKRTFDEIGGLEGVRTFLEKTAALITSNDEAVRQIVPSGLMFLGPPGTGKTAMAEAMANAGHVSMVKLGNIRGMYVGQSESNFSLALKIIRAMAPVIVFIDEIDQSEGSRGGEGDGGVDKRLFAMLLAEMSNAANRGHVLWIAASNRPDLVDDALRRSGRFDDKIPFLVPTPAGRRDILRRQLERKGTDLQLDLDDALRGIDVISQSDYDNLTGADIEVIVTRLVRDAVVQENRCVLQEHLKTALDNFVAGGNREKYELMSLLALRELTDRSFVALLPESFQSYLENTQLLEERIAHLQHRSRT